jgi:ADP-ribosylglycohydrolase
VQDEYSRFHKSREASINMSKTRQDRAMGAIMGAFVGEALGVGPTGITISRSNGIPCPFYHQLPAAYYLAARFNDDFESSVLHAINGGGQNQSRAMLTGALVGLAGIPQRLLDGLERADELHHLAQALVSQMPGPGKVETQIEPC